jgi:hypothetical protein
VETNDNVEPTADGKPETIPAKIIIEIPLPIPFSVICSPNHIKNNMERGQRRITVNYAKRQQGRKMVGGQSSYLPLKINMAGVKQYI